MMAMIVYDHSSELRIALQNERRAGQTIGFVPTMGALHAGHASLIEAARRDGHHVVVSIFVNPTQFGPNEDYQKYPRSLEADLRICREQGAALAYTPAVEEIYPPGDQTRVRAGRLADGMCGPFRPGHFDGVCTVVTKLFNIVQPGAAYFGQKDAQQAAIIRRMAIDLCMSIEIVVCPIVREPDGLAMSSRNAYLSPEHRAQAASLYRALCAGRDLINSGQRAAGKVIVAIKHVLGEAGPCTIDYIAAVDPQTLEDVSEIQGRVMLALAVRIGGTRLIDNLVAGTGPHQPLQ